MDRPKLIKSEESSEQKKMTITIVGVVTFSEVFHENFRLFNEAMQMHLIEAFPEFQPISPPITVIVDDISPDDIVLKPVNPHPQPSTYQVRGEEHCFVCGKAVKFINDLFLFHVEFDSSHQATLPPDHPFRFGELLEKSAEKLACWYNTLPAEWPEDLPGKPQNWDSLPLEIRRDDGKIDTGKRSKWGLVHDFRVNVRRVVGDKAILVDFYIHELNKNEQDFEQWWEKNGKDFSLSS